ncbi:MAG: hypothetical protein WCK75_00840 [Elusimicrobiota bacterium]
MQQPLITIEGGKPKKRLGLVPSIIVCAAAILLPPRARVYFVFFVNFVHNHILATARIVISFLGRRFTGALIFLTYYLAVGPIALFVRISGGAGAAAADEGSFFTEKEPEDSTRERFGRQY